MQNKKVLNYTMLRPLGVGGMAEVWYAENNIHKPGAVKFLLQKFCSDFDVVSRFRTEAEVMVRLNHPNIRQVYDYDEVDGRPCIVMEYLEGDDLASRMKHGERFTDEQLKNWWNQIADALNYTHQQGVVHRDLKPSNIFVDQKGNVKLLDFGIAKVRDSITSTHTGATMGTLMYMSPEQVRDSKHIDHKTDLYSLAVTFVHLLTGNAPYDRDTTDDFEIRNNIVNIPLGLDTLPLDWQNFLRPYLAKDPKERPALRIFDAAGADRGDFVPPVVPENPAPASEETEVGGATVSATSVKDENKVAENPKETPKKPGKKRKGLIIGIIVAVLVLVGGVMLAKLLGSGNNEEPIVPAVYVDLGLPSGTLWKGKNEEGFYDYDAAVGTFGDKLPTKEQLEELKTKCQWTWTERGYRVVGPNGQSIYLPAAGYRDCYGGVNRVGSYGGYWSSSPGDSEDAWYLYFYSGSVYLRSDYRCSGFAVRLVQD